MLKRIAFVSIFDITRLFFEIARGLGRDGHDIFWITTDRRWTGWLKDHGVNRGDILELVYTKPDFIDWRTKKGILRELIASEGRTELTANQVLMMDQFVKYKNKSDINEYVYLYYRDIKDFLIANRITHVIAEPTNINEMITYMLCRELGIEFIVPRPARYPHGRLLFMSSYRDSAYYPRLNPEKGISGERLIRDFIEGKPMPDYCVKHNKRRLLDFNKLVTSLQNRLRYGKILRQDNLTHHDLWGRIRLQLQGIGNALYMKFICRFDALEDINGRIAYFPLHVQPESSIDVMGSYFSDQLKLIKDIRRALPFDTTLVIKEHPNFLDMNKSGFFRELRRVPNVKLIRYDVSTFEVLQKAAIVFTVSGTSAYEAGLLGIPAITFCPMFFSGLSSVRTCPDISQLKDLVSELLDNVKRDYQADCKFMARLIGNSYPALWDNPLRSPQVLSNDNLRRLIQAFSMLLGDDAISNLEPNKNDFNNVFHDNERASEKAAVTL